MFSFRVVLFCPVFQLLPSSLNRSNVPLHCLTHPFSLSGGSSKRDDRHNQQCDICFSGDYSPYPLTCCSGSMCTNCLKQLQVQRCPFCNKTFPGMRGNQPDGKMDIKFEASQRLAGHEGFGSYTIKYFFHSGKQGVSYVPKSQKLKTELKLYR